MPFIKALYLAQPFPDNYTPPTFLSTLERNHNLASPSLATLLLSTVDLTAHLSSTLLYCAIFLHLLRGSLSSQTLLLLSGGLYLYSRPPLTPLVTLYLLSPLLSTLSKATTSDSIIALVSSLLVLNLSHSSPRPTLSLPSSILLSSRLSPPPKAFIFLLFSLLFFTPPPPSPLTQNKHLTTPLLSILAIGTLYSLGGTAYRFAVGGIGITAIVAPAVRAYLAGAYKDKIRGPWDLAVPVVGGGGAEEGVEASEG